MAGRRVFFSFHYSQDVWRAANVRNAGKVDATAAAGWRDASIWEEAERKGKAEVRRLIDAALKNTSVTAVLIGSHTAERDWVNYEITRSIERGNGLLGVHVHTIKDQLRKNSRRGDVPSVFGSGGYRTYDWNPSAFGRWVERAAIDAGKPCLDHQRKYCFACKYLRWW